MRPPDPLNDLREKLRSLGVTDLMVWGLRSNTHTHHYIHRAVFEAFSAVGHPIGLRLHWYDDEPIKLRRRSWLGQRRRFLVFTSPHYDVDRHLPSLPDAYYIAHAD